MKRFLMILLVAASFGSFVGCAKEKKRAAAPPAETPRSPIPLPTPSPNPSAQTDDETDLTIEGGSAESRRRRLAELFDEAAINSPTNIRFGMSVQKEGAGYGGEAWIQFNDGGKQRGSVFSTKHPLNPGIQDTRPNIWFTWQGKQVFHAFFQDRLSAIVVVIDDSLNLGDGQASELVGGSVWFQNFGRVIPRQGPNKMCWEIDIGPYDCRTFIVGGHVVTTSALYPNNFGGESNPPRQPYKKLGSFGSLLRSAVFID